MAPEDTSARPRALIVGGSHAFTVACRRILEDMAFDVITTHPESAAVLAEQHRPSAIIIARELAATPHDLVESLQAPNEPIDYRRSGAASEPEPRLVVIDDTSLDVGELELVLSCALKGS